MDSQGSSNLISENAIVLTVNRKSILLDTPMNRRPFISRTRSKTESSKILRLDMVVVFIALHCFLQQFVLMGVAARATDAGVAPFDQGHSTASHPMNHERMNVSPRLRHSKDDPEVRWRRRTQQTVAECSAYPVCAAAGLVNDCCPTSEGVFLGCCEVTSSPVSAPRNAPVSAPAPTDKPTLKPVLSTNPPTSSPVRKPTQSPTAGPQPLPTTNRPTRVPTLPPVSAAPITSRPTGQPITSSPVEFPTTPSPTLPPSTLSPVTLAPISSPNTSEPASTQPPVPTGSDEPTSVPSPFIELNVTSLTVPGVRLSLKSGPSSRRNLQDGDSNCTQVLKEAVVDRIEAEIVSIIQKYETLNVDLQNFTSNFSNSSLALYIFDVLVEIRSPMLEYEPNRYVEGPFDSQVEKNLFAETLRSTDCPEFSDVSTVDVVVPRKVEDKSPSESSGSSLSVGILAGIVAGAAVLMIVLGAIFIMSRKRRRILLEGDSSHHPMQKPTQEMPSNDYEFSEIDGFHFNAGDISTLGDPMSTETKKDFENATLESTGVDYDFKKAFLDSQSVTDSQLFEHSDGSSPRRRVSTLDDPSLLNGGSTSDIVTAAGDTQSSPLYGNEEQYDVIAPTGVLGLIIESSPTDGRPVVHNIKPTSPLAHVVRVGDRLVALDGVVVSALRASDVSRLIAEKKNKPRLLVFSRPMNL